MFINDITGNAYPWPIGEAGNEVAQLHQTQLVQALMLLNCGIATVCQPLIVYQHPVTCQHRPTSTNHLILCESGDGTSPCKNEILAPIYKRDEKASLVYKVATEKYRIDYARWSAVQKSLLRSLSKANITDKAVEEISLKLQVHARQEPKLPRLRQIIHQNITGRAMMDLVEGNGVSAAIVMDEGQNQVEGDMARHIGLQNNLWDGPAMLTMDRAGNEHVIAYHPRVSAFIKVHPAMFRKYLKKHGEVAQNAGLWARYLIAAPESLKGKRRISSTPPEFKALSKVHERMNVLMDAHDAMVTSGAIVRQVITFSEDAKNEWRAMARQVEADLGPGGILEDIGEAASKFMELTSRMAANLHYFCELGDQISVDTLRRAWTITGWHLMEYKRLFSRQGAFTREQVAATDLLKYLRRFWNGCGSGSKVATSKVLSYGPPSVRHAADLKHALQLLYQQGAVVKWNDPDRKQKEYIVLVDWYFGGAVDPQPQSLFHPNTSASQGLAFG